MAASGTSPPANRTRSSTRIGQTMADNETMRGAAYSPSVPRALGVGNPSGTRAALRPATVRPCGVPSKPSLIKYVREGARTAAGDREDRATLAVPRVPPCRDSRARPSLPAPACPRRRARGPTGRPAEPKTTGPVLYRASASTSPASASTQSTPWTTRPTSRSQRHAPNLLTAASPRRRVAGVAHPVARVRGSAGSRSQVALDLGWCVAQIARAAGSRSASGRSRRRAGAALRWLRRLAQNSPYPPRRRQSALFATFAVIICVCSL